MRHKMKKHHLLLLSFLLLLILSGCSIKQFYYHSEANLPYFDRATKSAFTLIKKEDISAFKFGVISATDDDTLSYVLISPKEARVSSVKDLPDDKLDRAIPLKISQVKEFLEILNASSNKWDKKFDAENGISYEYMVAPEYKINRVSENVAEWIPMLRFYFQNNEEGSKISLIIGKGKIRYLYESEQHSRLRDLIELLELSIENQE